jgi:hypothetical protein
LSNAAKSAVTKDDEQAAMAAMFQAQTANWEETQEKMSQLVLRLGAFVLRSRTMSHERDFIFLPCLCIKWTVPSASTPTPEELDLLVGALASPISPRLITTISLIDLCLPAMSVIAVVRKVSCYTFVNYLLVSLILSKGYEPHDCRANNNLELDIIEAPADGNQLARGMPALDGGDARSIDNAPPQIPPPNYVYVCYHCGETG